MCKHELQYWDWLAKVTERLTFARLKINDRKDISDEDYQLLKILLPIWYHGEYPIFQTKMEGTAISVTQMDIFSAIPSEEELKECDGTLLDKIKEETNQEENEKV